MNNAIRWIVATILAALAAAIIAFPTAQEERPYFVDPLQQQADIARDHWDKTSEAFRRAQARAVAASVGRTPSAAQGNGQPYMFVHHADTPAEVDRLVETQATRAFSLMPRRDRGVPIVITAILDTGGMGSGAPIRHATDAWSTDVLMPSVASSGACVVVVRAGSLMDVNRKVHTIDDLAGPCWWYAVFGVPGRGIAALLDSTASQAIANDALRPRRSRGSMGMLGWSLAFGYARRDRITTCLQSRPGACTRLILTPQPASVEHEAFGSVAGASGWTSAGRRFSTPSNDVASALLLRMIDVFGLDAFERIWKSNDDLPTAFATVAGTSLDAWVRVQITGAAQRFADDAHPGALNEEFTMTSWLRDPEPSHPALALVILIPALIGLGALGASRREGLS